MWELKKINDDEYFFNLEIREKGQLYEFCLTNFCQLWYTEMSKDEIIARCKENNCWLEAEDETLLSETLGLFDIKREDVQWNLSHLTGHQLFLSSTFEGIQFSFTITFDMMNEEKFFKFVMSPLLLTIKNLKLQNEFLQKSIRKKDIEIAEYKLDGAVISRKNIETPTFQETLLPNLFDDKKVNLSFSRPSDLIDDQILSTFNETYAEMKSKLNNVEKSEKPMKQLTKENHVEQTKSHKEVKVPKMSEPEPVVKTEQSISVIPAPAPMIKKKLPPRKLKNL